MLMFLNCEVVYGAEAVENSCTAKGLVHFSPVILKQDRIIYFIASSLAPFFSCGWGKGRIQ